VDVWELSQDTAETGLQVGHEATDMEENLERVLVYWTLLVTCSEREANQNPLSWSDDGDGRPQTRNGTWRKACGVYVL